MRTQDIEAGGTYLYRESPESRHDAVVRVLAKDQERPLKPRGRMGTIDYKNDGIHVEPVVGAVWGSDVRYVEQDDGTLRVVRRRENPEQAVVRIVVRAPQLVEPITVTEYEEREQAVREARRKAAETQESRAARVSAATTALRDLGFDARTTERGVVVSLDDAEQIVASLQPAGPDTPGFG